MRLYMNNSAVICSDTVAMIHWHTGPNRNGRSERMCGGYMSIRIAYLSLAVPFTET